MAVLLLTGRQGRTIDPWAFTSQRVMLEGGEMTLLINSYDAARPSLLTELPMVVCRGLAGWDNRWLWCLRSAL